MVALFLASFLSHPIVFGTSISEVLQDAALISIIWAAFKHFNCHVNEPKFCWRWGHAVHGTSFRACHKHDDERPDDGRITAHHIMQARKKFLERI